VFRPELRHVRAVGAIERSPEGAPLRVFGMYFDDTVQCQREAAITRAREAAESANRAKSVFLANMSHELRTPLNAILGFTQLISYDPAIGEENRGQLQVVYRSAEHLLALIDNVLELARVEAGRIQSVTEAFGLDDLVTTVGEIIRVRAEAKKLDLSVTVAPAVAGVVTGDAVHLRQVLVNLLGNAVKYTELGQVQLTVSPLADRVLFEVMDTGAGIASAELERIFQPFYQTRAGVETGEGVGLGLSISREFVRLMGGELTVRSVIGKGTTFAFAIPLPALDFSVLPEAPENEGTADRATPVPDGIDLSGVPDTLRRDLAAAADLLDLEASRNLLERLRCNHPVEAVVLGELIDGYRFESVSRLCRGKAA
jgi:signal transduction histidine kinase